MLILFSEWFPFFIVAFMPASLSNNNNNNNNTNNNNNNNNLFTYNAQVSIYIFTCVELKFFKRTNYKYIK